MVKKVLAGMLMGILIAVSMYGCASPTLQYTQAEVSEAIITESQLQENTQECVDAHKKEPKTIYVYVCGAVYAPGVYAIEEGSRICDLFQIAGGLTEGAAEDYWNQARILSDGEMIYVPTEEEAKERSDAQKSAAGSTTGQSDTNSGETKKININTASIEELMTLPGIGEAKALAIIAYRQENGDFSNIEQLKDISGIKDGVYTKIKDYIVVN